MKVTGLSAQSGYLFGDGEVVVVRGVEDCTGAVGQFVGAEETTRFDDFALGVDPVWLDRVEPGASAWEIAGDDADASAVVLNLLVVVTEPAANLLAHVPARVVPGHQEGSLAESFQSVTDPLQEPRGYRADGSAVDEAEPDLIADSPIGLREPEQDAIAGQRLRVGISARDPLLDEAQRSIRLRPGGKRWSGQSTPPGLILVAKHPLRMDHRKTLKSVSSPLFRV